MAHHSAPVTSETLAKAMRTNPVVLRRIMGGLRDAGYVSSGKGHGGGWVLSRDLADVTLRDIYTALGSPALFALGNRTGNPQCLVEQAVNASLDQALDEAEQRLLDHLGTVTLAMLDADIRARGASRRLTDLETIHGGA
jgi:Rrf2 family protein